MESQPKDQRRQINYGFTDAINYNYYVAMGHKNYYQNSSPNPNDLNQILPGSNKDNNNYNNYYITFTKRRTRSTQTTTSTTTTSTNPPMISEEYEIITTEIPTTTITPQVLWWSRFNYVD